MFTPLPFLIYSSLSSRLRQEASVRNIARELAAAKPIQIVRLLAYRNGDGHTKAGQLLIGSSIIGVSIIDWKQNSISKEKFNSRYLIKLLID